MLNYLSDTGQTQILNFLSVFCHLEALVMLSSVSLGDSYDALAQIPWCMPSVGKRP